MTERITTHYDRTATSAAKPSAKAHGKITDGRTFAEFLAEAEAVRDVVDVSLAGGAHYAAPRGATIQEAIHGVQAALANHLPNGWSALRVGKRRREE